MEINFEYWLKQQGIEKVKDCLEENGIKDPTVEGKWKYPCKNCGNLFPIICNQEEFNPDNHYCGKDEHCCP